MTTRLSSLFAAITLGATLLLASLSVAAQAASAPEAAPAAGSTHANGATHIDHVVLLSPDLARTTAALACGFRSTVAATSSSHRSPRSARARTTRSVIRGTRR